MRRILVRFIEKAGVQSLIFVPFFLIMVVLLLMTYENRVMIQRLSENIASESEVNQSVPSENTPSESILSNGITSKSTVIADLWSLPAVTTTPIRTFVLKPNALLLWSLYTREKHSRRGEPSDNENPMYVFDIPSDVLCQVWSESSSWLPMRYQRWRLDCTTSSFTEPVAFIINGIAAQGLTGGIYYNTGNPLLISGLGSWPEICYETITTSLGSSVPIRHRELNGTPTPEPNSPQRQR